MKCNKCCFENSDLNKFCENCGNSLILNNNKRENKNNLENDINTELDLYKKISKYLSNKIVSFLFLIMFCLTFIYSIISAYVDASQCEPGGCSGFFIIFIPIIACIYSMPLFFGLILSLINLAIKKHIMLILEIVSCVFSLKILLYAGFVESHNRFMIFKYVIVILTVILIIVCLSKFILSVYLNLTKRKNNIFLR